MNEVPTAEAAALVSECETHTNYSYDNPWPMSDATAHRDSYPGDGWTTEGQHEVEPVDYHTEMYSGYSEEEHPGCGGGGQH